MTIGANPGTRSCATSRTRRNNRNLKTSSKANGPAARHSRLTSWFACDSPERAARYLETQLDYEQNSGEVLCSPWKCHPPANNQLS